MNGGYILVDGKGINLNQLPTVVPGLYARFDEAIASKKMAVVSNFTLGGEALSPFPASLNRVSDTTILAIGPTKITVTEDDTVDIHA